MICKTFDIVVVPFPFTDKPGTKNRPALILSSPKSFNIMAEHSIMAMITSASDDPWPLDVPLENFASYGLNKPCLIRLKLFTIDNRLIKKIIGSLNPHNRKEVIENLQNLFQESLK